jgi:hypothetical protein
MASESMGVLLSAGFLIAMGSGILAVGWRGYLAGEINAGSRGFLRAYRPNREDNPFAYRFYVCLYFCGGMAMVVWGLLIMTGAAPPLQWR